MKLLSTIFLILISVSTFAQEKDKASAIIRPDIFPVYENVNFEVIISPNIMLQTGDSITCQLPNSFNADLVSPSFIKQWQFDDEESKHYISITTDGTSGTKFSVQTKKRDFVGGYIPSRHGVCLNIVIKNGKIEEGENIIVSYKNTTSPWVSIENPGEEGQEGLVYVAINGHQIDNFPQFKVYSAEEKQFRVIVPSSVKPGQKFPVKMISLDMYNNLSYTTHRDISIKCQGINLATGINFCGRGVAWVSLPNKGVYRLEAAGTLSNPVKVTDTPNGPYWGDLHGHSCISSDAVGSNFYGYARDVSCLDFAALMNHERQAAVVEAYWQQTVKCAKQYYKLGEFVPLLGVEAALYRIHFNMYLPVDEAPALPSFTSEGVLQYTINYKAIGQTHHPGWGFDMRVKYPNELKLLEVYSMHGQSEYYDNKTLLSMANQRHREGGKDGPYYARDAWALGKKWFTVGGSDNHFCQPGVHYNALCAIYANELSRMGIYNALLEGTSYETTGERIILEFSVNGKPMGSELKLNPGEELNFYLSINGTDQLQKVEVFGCPYIEGDNSVDLGKLMFPEDDPQVKKALSSWKTIFVQDEITEMDYSASFNIPAPNKKMVYYMKVTQKNLIELPCKLEGRGFYQKRPVVAWSSPIWLSK